MFWFFFEQDSMPNNLKLDYTTFKVDFETIVTLNRLSRTSLNKPQRQCEPRRDYICSDCLDRIFRRKDCQDPWNFKPSLSHPVCTNLSEILESYAWSGHGR